MATTPPFRKFLAPRHWPTWLGIGLLWLIAWLPYRLRMACGTLIGMLSHGLAGERRYITATNVGLCFPELGAAEQESLVRQSFIANGIGLIETATGWVRSAEHFRGQVEITGLETLLAARARGRGVLMLGAHYSTLDFAANLLSLSCPFAVTYRPHKNPLFDAFMQRGRLRNCNGVFDRHDIRGALRHLKRGEVLWYAPDQDYGPEHSVYAPFFGQTAATITTPARFARFNASPVVIVRHHRKEAGKGYELDFTLVTEDYPSGDEARDAALINARLEQAIRRYPHQYLWMHKRFKTQPGGKPASPYIAVKTRSRKLRLHQYDALTRGALDLEKHSPRDRLMQLPGGLRLRLFPGLPSRFRPGRHAAWRFDRGAKQLRLRGIASVTVDTLFEVPMLEATALTYHAPAGTTLDRLLAPGSAPLPRQKLAQLFADLHAHGFALDPVRLDQLLYDGAGFVVLNPEDLRTHPTDLSYRDRLDNLQALFQDMRAAKPGFPESELERLGGEYLRAAGLEHVTDLSEPLLALCRAPVLDGLAA